MQIAISSLCFFFWLMILHDKPTMTSTIIFHPKSYMEEKSTAELPCDMLILAR